MVLARMSTWTFKKGKEEEGLLALDTILNSSARLSKGFRGYMSLVSADQANTVVVLTLWQDEEALNASAKGVFAEATQKAQDMLETPPISRNLKVFSTELFQRQEKEKQ
jgi:heme-degrading monooxygenase HmoA